MAKIFLQLSDDFELILFLNVEDSWSKFNMMVLRLKLYVKFIIKMFDLFKIIISLCSKI